MSRDAAALTNRFSDWYARESDTTNYDVFMRLPALLYFGFTLWLQGGFVWEALFAARDWSPALRIATIAATSGTFVVAAIFAGLTVLRSKPVARASGIYPRLVAILAVVFLFSMIYVEPSKPVLHWQIGSAVFVFVSAFLTAIVVLRLGRSFSTMPEARKLVRTGAYRFVRHPLYLAEELAVIGMLMQYRSPLAFALVAIQFVLQVERMKCEEAVLREAFPEYDDYAKQTARIIPGVY